MEVLDFGSTGEAATTWLWMPAPQAQGAVRVVCFPCLGADIALYRRWADALAPRASLAAVRLPGRGGRRREPALTDLDAAVAALTDAVDEVADEPYALFGYSMGGLLAFEVARRLRRRGAPAPRALVVAARSAPHEPGPAVVPADAPDDDLVRMLRRLGGTPEEILSSPEMLPFVLPAVRADLAVLGSHRYREEAPLSCPIVALSGADDPVCPPEAHVEWRAHTTASFSHVVLPGGHDFVTVLDEEVASLVRQAATTGSVGR